MRIELGVVADRMMLIAAEQGLAFAPSAASNQLVMLLNNEIRLIDNQLAVYPEHRSKCGLHLFDLRAQGSREVVRHARVIRDRPAIP